MTACVKIKYGTLIVVIFLMYIQLGKLYSTQTASYEMNWWTHCPAQNISLSCSQGQYIFILDAYGERRSNQWRIFNSTISKLMAFCNCKALCNIYRKHACIYIYNMWWKSWTLYIKFQCTNDDCSDNTRNTTSLSPDTTTTKMLSSGSTNATSFSPSATPQLPPSTTKMTVTENTSDDSTTPDTSTTLMLSSESTNATGFSPSATSLHPLSTSKTTVTENSSSKQSTALGDNSMTTSLSETTTKLAEKNVSSSSVARITRYTTTIHTTNKPQTDLYSDTDEKNTDKVIIAVCVSVIGFGLVGCILAVILYRRWRKKKTIDYMYSNNTTTENADTGFSNLTYSEKANNDDMKHDDTQSHSADSGYTDMRIDETLDDTNDDYYSIKDSKEETLQPENDNYYDIKENVSQEYNKITFRPKSIPEDPSYVHTLCATNIKDKTYDHVDGKECIKSELQNDDYSHLNQRKDHACNNTRCRPVGEAVKEDSIAIEPNEEGGGYTSDHKYFTLEMNNYERKTEVDKENDVSHGYFVLEKEIPTKMNLAEGNDVGKKHVQINTAVVVQENDPSMSSTDHVYFENCRQTDAESDSHQYQALKSHTSDPVEKPVENVNHDYFILDKETKATEIDKETDVSHTYFVLEDEIPAINNSKHDNDFRKTHATVHATSAVKEMKHATSSSDQTYFEDCLQVGNASDTHQYQTLEQHILDPNDEYPKAKP